MSVFKLRIFCRLIVKASKKLLLVHHLLIEIALQLLHIAVLHLLVRNLFFHFEVFLDFSENIADFKNKRTLLAPFSSFNTQDSEPVTLSFCLPA